MKIDADEQDSDVDDIILGGPVPCRSTLGDVGRNYEAVIRANSQSGGAASPTS